MIDGPTRHRREEFGVELPGIPGGWRGGEIGTEIGTDKTTQWEIIGLLSRAVVPGTIAEQFMPQ
jgi:hypothetical protein